jgi:hypothetical protein
MTRAADDFPAIRTRLEELRRERIRVAANNDPHRADGRRSYESVVDHFKERPAF